MTEQQIRDIVALWQPRLGLAHWRIELEFGAILEDEHHDADCGRMGDYDHATIRFSAKFPEWPERYTEELVVHELLHCHFHHLWVAAADARKQLHGDAARLSEDAFERAQERVVERLAWTLVALARGLVNGDPLAELRPGADTSG